ncbi:MAG: glycosyltransferase family 4 protein [Candidatus Geothermarchaeales archaeon]
MNILIVIGYLHPVIGGTELAGYNVAKHLAMRGHEVTVVTRYSVGFRPEIIKHIGSMRPYEELYGGRLRIHRVRLLPTMFGRFLSDVLNALRIGWRTRPDAILAFTLMPHSFSAMVVRYALQLTRFRDVPVVVWGRGSDVMVTPKRKDMIGLLTRLLLGIVFRADLVLAQTPAMRETLVEYGCDPEKIEVLGNGIDLSQYSPSAEASDNTVAFVGAARPAKGLPYLIQAINQLPSARLLVIGGWGEQRDLCRSMARENTEFIGAVPPHRVKDYLRRATIFCLPSLSEGFPNSVLEAMASGLPIVATNVGGTPYVVGDAGVLVAPGDVDALRAALASLLENPARREEYRLRSLERVKRFTWGTVVADLERLIVNIKGNM